MRDFTRSAFAVAAMGLCAAAMASPAAEGRDYVDEAILFGQTQPVSMEAQKTISKWPEHSKDLAGMLISEFGPPAVLESDRMSWNDQYPWKSIVVFREQQSYDRPGILRQSVVYDVPVGRWRELVAFDRGVMFDVVRRELVARSDSVATNLLALNLAEEVIQGRRSAVEARTLYDRTLALSFAGKSSSYMSRLLFRPRPPSGSKR